MAEHVVPQDVETTDKIIGPFGIRQLAYLLVAAAAGFLAYLLARVYIPLLFIPLPVALFFIAIALPLRRDQPTEIYLAAVVRFFLKPKTRLWVADGGQPLVEISAPIIDDRPRIKDIQANEASQRLSFLANLSDTQGWSSKGLTAPSNETNLADQFASAAINTTDVLEDSEVSNNIDNLLNKSNQKIRSNAERLLEDSLAQPSMNSGQPAQVFNPLINNTPDIIQANAVNLANPDSYNIYDISGGANLQVGSLAPKHNLVVAPPTMTNSNYRVPVNPPAPVAIEASKIEQANSSTPMPTQTTTQPDIIKPDETIELKLR